jgi:hypothetical protein
MQTPAARSLAMPTTLETVVAKYLRSGNPAQRTREEYSTTLRKWARWGSAVPIEKLGRKEIREFLDWVYEDAAVRDSGNPGRTANKVRSHLRAVMAWAWEQDMVDALPRFPKVKSQRIVAGRYYLTRPEINSLYFATHQMKRPRGWSQLFPIGRYWRSALVVFFNYGLDTGTVWRTESFHEPILWRHVSWERQSPDREAKEQSPWGWLFYRRLKTHKAFYRPMNRTVHAHIKSIMPDNVDPDAPVFLGGGTRPNNRFRTLCGLAGIGPKTNVETGEEQPWVLKDLARPARPTTTSTSLSHLWRFLAIQLEASRIVTMRIGLHWHLRQSCHCRNHRRLLHCPRASTVNVRAAGDALQTLAAVPTSVRTSELCEELSSCVTKGLDAIGSMEPTISDFSLLVSGEHCRSAHLRAEFASEMLDYPAIVAELKKLQPSLVSRSNEHAAGSPKLAPKKSPSGTSTARPAEPSHGKPGTGNSLA